MCGIAGIMSYGVGAEKPSKSELLAIRDHMRSRGPDGAGLWRSQAGSALLAHRRLSILDLSERGAQPMQSEDGRLAVTFNGEIYNYPELRTELEQQGARFRTTTDTEVLLHLYARDGCEMMRRLRGMFAFAIYDSSLRQLYMARDPYGIKPLYYTDDGETFRFASQVKALLAGGGVDDAIDPAGIAGFCLLGSVPEPFTTCKAIHALSAGHALLVDSRGARMPQPYLSVSQILVGAKNEGAEDLPRRAQAALRESVGAHLLADVEIGLFLSSGVDSGALLGLMRDCGQSRIRAVTLAFEEFVDRAEDEAPLAARIAAQYEAEHVVRRVTREEYHADAEKLFAAMDQPSIDGVNVFFIAKAARELGLKVAISGIGGDELFAGYPSFSDIPAWTRATYLPKRLPGFGTALRKVGEALLPSVSRRNPKLFSVVQYGGSYEGAYFLRRGMLLPHELPAMLGDEFAREGLENLDLFRLLRFALTPEPDDALRRVCALESGLYMRNQLLRDSDWAGMAHSVEIRTPLVDTELLRAIAPFTVHLKPGVGKAVLAAAPSYALLPDAVSRPKTGFSVPISAWLDGEAKNRLTSRAWARRVLSEFGVSLK